MRQTLDAVVSVFLWIAGSVVFLTLGMVFVLLGVVFPPRYIYPLARVICRSVLVVTGQRLQVVGTPPPLASGPYIYLFNHTSMMDAFVVVSSIPEFTGAIGKYEQFSIPFWGTILRRYGVVPINRGKLGDAIQILDEVETAVNGGLSMAISPEGTRSKDGKLLPFKKGPFHIARNTGTPLVVLRIEGCHRAKSPQSWLIRPGLIKVTWGEVIHPCDYPEATVEDLLEQCRRGYLS